MSQSKLHMMERKKRRQESYQEIKSKIKCALKKDEDIFSMKIQNLEIKCITHTHKTSKHKHFPDCGPGILDSGRARTYSDS